MNKSKTNLNNRNDAPCDLFKHSVSKNNTVTCRFTCFPSGLSIMKTSLHISIPVVSRSEPPRHENPDKASSAFPIQSLDWKGTQQFINTFSTSFFENNRLDTRQFMWVYHVYICQFDKGPQSWSLNKGLHFLSANPLHSKAYRTEDA